MSNTDIKKNQILSRKFKLETIGLNDSYDTAKISNKLLDEMYADVITYRENCNKGVYVSTPKTDKVNKTDPKYVLTLEILNAIFKTLNKDIIEDITEFKNIKKNDLIKKECMDIINSYINNIVESFCGDDVDEKILLFRRTKGKNGVINITRMMVINCGYKFISKQKNVPIKKDNYIRVRYYFIE
jgi:hypothetical protein